jgi:hypothetical protein
MNGEMCDNLAWDQYSVFRNSTIDPNSRTRSIEDHAHPVCVTVVLRKIKTQFIDYTQTIS